MVCHNPRCKPGRPEVRGPKGDSAYEVWVKAQPPGSDVSLGAYFKAITGLSAYEDWAKRQPAGTDTSFDAFMAAHKGQSAYQVWACYQPPGADTSLEAFMEYMKGKKGDDGQSFYEWWVSKQPEGADTSDSAFMEAMKGKPGEPGKDGTVADFDQNQFTTKTVDGKTVITIKNDPDLSNQLSVIGTEGLFVRPASAQVRAKDESVRVAGIPQDKNGGFNTEVSVNSIPVKNNQLGIRKVGSTEGLYVQSAHEELLSPNKTLSIKTSATEVPFEPAKTDIDVVISKEEGNSLVIKEDGLFAGGGGGGDLDSKYIKIEEASEKKDDAVGGGDGTIVIGSGAGNGEMGPSNKATVVGALAKSLDDGGTVVGYNSSATGKQGVAIGFGTKAAQSATALGHSAQATGTQSLAIAANSTASGDSAVAVGREAKATHKNAVAAGYAAETDREQSFSVGSASLPRQITHVAPATENTDSPNWEQVQNLIQTTILKSTKEKPVNLGTLTGPMTYRISEGDYNAETNPYPYTIIDAPNFSDRSATIEVYVHTNGKLQYCKTPDEWYSRKRGTAGPRGQWGIVTNEKTAPSYYFGGVNGTYWLIDTGIFTKDEEKIVIGTEQEPVNTMFVPFMNPLAPSTGNGVLTGISHAYGYNGAVKLLLQRRTGTPSGAAPHPHESFNYALISDEYKNKVENQLALLAADATQADIIARVNQIIQLLGTARVANIA